MGDLSGLRQKPGGRYLGANLAFSCAMRVQPGVDTPGDSGGADTDEPARASDSTDELSPLVIRMPVDVRSLSLTVLAVAALLLLTREAAEVLIPIVFGILISYVLNPLVNQLERFRMPRVLAATIVLLLLVGGLAGGGYALSGQAMTIVDGLPEAAERLRARIEESRRQPDDGALEKVQMAAAELEEAAGEAAGLPAPRTPGVQRVEIVEPAFRASDYLWAGGVSVVGLLAQLTVVLFLVFFILATGDLYKRKLVHIAGPTLARKKLTVQILDEINLQIGHYVRVQVVANVIVAFVTALALWLLGVEQYIVWGLLAGVFNTIPYFGPAIVTAGLGVVAFLQFDDLVQTLYVCAAAGAITGLEGMLLRPAMLSRASQINPVAIFMGLLLWTWLWGLWGTVLAVPILMMLKSVSDRIESLQPLGELLGGEAKSAG
jgi:predicted PurR-regulated permease PerM